MKRIAFLDYLRIFACFLVMLVHASENYYGSDSGGMAGPMSFLANESDRFWVSLYDGFSRMSVPLFMMVSAFLLVPMREGQSAFEFYKRRAVRILPGLVIFMVLYSTLPLLWGQLDAEASATDLRRLLLNFPSLAGHFWFMYPLLGLYLFIPIISPWLSKVSPKEERLFIWLFVFSTCIPYLNRFCGEVFGQCFWNEYHLFWYFSGYLGYLVLAHYIRIHLDWSVKKRLAVGIPLLVAGAVATILSFYVQAVPGQEISTPVLEVGWSFCTINVVALTAGAFLLFTVIPEHRVNNKVVELSNLTYGMYLMHIFWLYFWVIIFKNDMMLPTGIAIPAIAVATFLSCIVACKMLAMLPGGKWLLGLGNPSRRGLKIAVVAALLCMTPEADACTNFIVGRKASADGSVMVSYADDSHTRFGDLFHSPRGKHAPGSMRKVIDWGDNSYRGEIPQAPETYNVVGNMNEHQLVIGETTWGGHKELEDTTGNSLLDYGSLIYIALERCKTAREAIKLMTDLVDKYGYASSGESFSIADKNEAWIMEMIGKGAEKGAVWIAVRIPDDAICAHANEPRIRKVDYKEKDNVVHSKDLFKFARKRGYFDGKDEDFSFADAFDNHPAATRRSCDARVWSFFRRFASPQNGEKWFGWVNSDSDEPMPLFIVPDRKVSLRDMQEGMRDHFENTPYDMVSDPGAGPNRSPYRNRPMRYEVDGKTYTHERAIATQQTAWHFVSQSRADLPDPIGGLLWFGTDDTNTSVYMPFYCCMTEVPLEVRPGNGDLYTFSPTANFWMTNWVANQAYGKYDLMIDDIRKVQGSLEKKFISNRPEIEKEMLSLYDSGNHEALEKLVNEQGAAVAKEATDAYRDLAHFLLIRYLDGNRKKIDENGQFARNKDGKPLSPDFTGYPEDFYRIIVEKSGDRLRLK